MDIRAKVVTAIRWTAAARFLGQLLSWAITIVVIRILSPQDYGLMAMAAVVIAFLVILNTIGQDAVLVQRRELSDEVRRQIFGIVIAANLLVFVGLEISAPWIAGFYNEPRLTPIVRVLAFQFVVLIFETLPISRLEREINFKLRSIVDLTTMLAGSLVTLGLAYIGMGVWALVWGAVVTTTTRVAGINIIEPYWCWPTFSLKGMKSSLSFGGFITADRVVRFVFAETDKLLGGKLLGKEALGYYAVASHLATLPIQKLTGLINAVAFPAFSHVQMDKDKVGNYLLRAGRVMSVLAFPIFVGMSSVAPELVGVLLGPKWHVVGIPLQILSLLMPLRMIMNIFQPLLWGIGRPDISATNFLIAALVMPVAFVIGAEWGIVGMSMAWLIAYPAVFLVTLVRALRVVEVRVADFLLTMSRPALLSGVMYIVVLVANNYVAGHSGELLHLIQLVITGAVAYAVLLLTVHREGFGQVMELIRR